MRSSPPIPAWRPPASSSPATTAACGKSGCASAATCSSASVPRAGAAPAGATASSCRRCAADSVRRHPAPHGEDRMIPRIIFVSPSAEIGELAREMAPAGFELVVVRGDGPELAAALGEAQYMMCYPHVSMKDAFYRAAPKLKLVQLLSAGYDSVDLEAARRAKVPIANNGGANAIAVAEHALLLMLAVARKVVWQHANV